MGGDVEERRFAEAGEVVLGRGAGVSLRLGGQGGVDRGGRRVSHIHLSGVDTGNALARSISSSQLMSRRVAAAGEGGVVVPGVLWLVLVQVREI